MPIRLGIMAHSYRRQLRAVPPLDGLEFMIGKAKGFAAEFGLESIALDFRCSAAMRRDADLLRRLAARLAAEHVVPVLHVGFVQLTRERETAEPALQSIVADLDVARALGCAVAQFSFAHNGRVTRDGRVRLAVEQLRVLASEAAERGLCVVTEDYDWFTSAEFQRIFDAVASPHLGLNNDTGNWLLLGEDPLEATRAMAPYTMYAHVRDYVLQDGVYTGVPLGAGLLDMPLLLSELRGIARSRGDLTLTCEMDLDEGDAQVEDDGTRACLRYLAHWLRRSPA